MKKIAISFIICSLLLVGCSSSNVEQISTTLQDINQLIEDTEQVVNTYAEEATTIIDSNLENAQQSLEAISNEAIEAVTTQTNTNTTDTSSNTTSANTVTSPEEYDYVLTFPSNRYPETALHISGAIEQGYSDVCTIDREGADDNRKESLKGIDTKDGYDRDEWPMAMCQEGGAGASVAYISASDNRGAGSWVGNELSQYENGERVIFIVEKPTQLFPTQVEQEVESDNDEPISYSSCAAVIAANAAPLNKGDAGYSLKLDRDGDGVACET